MDIRQLKAFIAVFEERNITLAARRLCLTQPTLSVTIRQLEEALGTSLFARQARGVEVTEDARLLYPQARRLVDQAAAVGRLFRVRVVSEPLTLGIDADLGAAQVEAFLALAWRTAPALTLTVVDGCGGDARLAAEESRCEDELFLPLWEEAFVLALPALHPLARKAALDMADLGGADWITCPSHSSHQRLLALHGEGSCGLGQAAHAGSLGMALRMVAAGIGLALLPQSLPAGRADVATRTLAGPSLTRRVGLCYAAQALDKPAVAALCAQLLAAAPTAGRAVRSPGGGLLDAGNETAGAARAG
jgi:DNA-binding transcriptional LysR family regulator